jgi:hypothetical protein
MEVAEGKVERKKTEQVLGVYVLSKRVRKIAKRDYLLCYVCLSISQSVRPFRSACPHRSTWFPLEDFQ